MGDGAALKQAIHVARERVGITSDRQLSVRSGVHYDTLMNWFAERTTPRPAELKKVADTVGVRLVELMDVWEGRDPTPPGIEERLGELVDELHLVLMELRESQVQQGRREAALLRSIAAVARVGLAHTNGHASGVSVSVPSTSDDGTGDR